MQRKQHILYKNKNLKIPFFDVIINLFHVDDDPLQMLNEDIVSIRSSFGCVYIASGEQKIFFKSFKFLTKIKFLIHFDKIFNGRNIIMNYFQI